jgi:hypothetical protein
MENMNGAFTLENAPVIACPRVAYADGPPFSSLDTSKLFTEFPLPQLLVERRILESKKSPK